MSQLHASDSGVNQTVNNAHNTVSIEFDKTPQNTDPTSTHITQSLLRTKHARRQKATIISSISSLVLSIIGPGTLAIPYAVTQTGYLMAAILFISVAIINTFTLNLNMECAKQLIPSSSYYLLCIATTPRLKRFVDITVVFATFGVLCVNLVVIGDLLPDIMYTIFNEHQHIPSVLFDRRLWISIYLIVFIVPTARLKRMDNLRFTSLFAMLCYLYVLSMIVIYAFDETLNPCRDDDPHCKGNTSLYPTNYLKIFKALPFFIQIYSCHFNAFSICNELKNATTSRLKIVSFCSIFMSMIMYSVVGFGAYMTYGDNIQSNIILKYPKSNSLLILRIALSIAIVFGYPVTLQSPRKCLSTLLFKVDDIYKLSNTSFYGITYMLVGCSFGVAMITDDITAIFGLVGSTATIIVVFVLPPMFYYNFKFDSSYDNDCKRYWSLLFIVFGILMIPFCITMQYVRLD